MKILIGNLFESSMQTRVNTVNCVGVMGKGIALEFKRLYPDMYKDYQQRCSLNQVKLGEPYLYSDLFGTSVVNFPTKGHWRAATKLSDVIAGLDFFLQRYKEWNIQSIAFPPLGCGNGGLSWGIVGPLMYQKLQNLDIPVEIYAPFGTSNTELTEGFLSQNVSAKEVKGVIQKKIHPEWIPLLETIYQLEKQPYVSSVGRVVLQKIAFILTELKVPTGWQFSQNNFGPYSPDLKIAQTVFANANLIREEQLGKMTATRIGTEYPVFRERYQDILDQYKTAIDKTVDLFSRVRNTEQAEEISTVIFAVKTLKQSEPIPTEFQVLEYIQNWKPPWKESPKSERLAMTIRNLLMLRWIKIIPSEGMILADDL